MKITLNNDSVSVRRGGDSIAECRSRALAHTDLRNVFAIDTNVFLLIRVELARSDRCKMRNDLYLVERRNVVYGVIYIANAGADNVTRDYDYRVHYIVRLMQRRPCRQRLRNVHTMPRFLQ